MTVTQFKAFKKSTSISSLLCINIRILYNQNYHLFIFKRSANSSAKNVMSDFGNEIFMPENSKMPRDPFVHAAFFHVHTEN